jgi:hypothetical protein
LLILVLAFSETYFIKELDGKRNSRRHVKYEKEASQFINPEVLYGDPPTLTDTEDSDDETDDEEATGDSEADDVYYQLPFLTDSDSSDSEEGEIDECYTIELGASGEIAFQSLFMKQPNLLFIFRQQECKRCT